jgi:hypothetical protein
MGQSEPKHFSIVEHNDNARRLDKVNEEEVDLENDDADDSDDRLNSISRKPERSRYGQFSS